MKTLIISTSKITTITSLITTMAICVLLLAQCIEYVPPNLTRTESRRCFRRQATINNPALPLDEVATIPLE